MSHIVVTLEYGRDSRDLALPPDVPVRLLIEGFTECLGMNTKAYTLALKEEHGLKPLPANGTLGEMDVLHGAILILLADERGVRPTLSTSPSAACLKTDNGRAFPLGGLVVIGRTDAKSGIFVEIDLGDFVRDPKIISRRHAQIEQQGGRYYIVDLGSVNGTKVNGLPIGKNIRQLLADGDRLEFGRNGVKMVFLARGK